MVYSLIIGWINTCRQAYYELNLTYPFDFLPGTMVPLGNIPLRDKTSDKDRSAILSGNSIRSMVGFKSSSSASLSCALSTGAGSERTTTLWPTISSWFAPIHEPDVCVRGSGCFGVGLGHQSVHVPV